MDSISDSEPQYLD